jgi:hypothetical protein
MDTTVFSFTLRKNAKRAAEAIYPALDNFRLSRPANSKLVIRTSRGRDVRILPPGIRTRTAEGRSRAKAQGHHMGRPPAPHTAAAERGHPTPGATLDKLARSYNVGISTIRRVTRAA